MQNKTYQFKHYYGYNIYLYILEQNDKKNTVSIFRENDLMHRRRNNNRVKNFFNIVNNIKKLSHGKIKKYEIFTVFELEALCEYLNNEKILYTISIEDKTGDILCDKYYDIFNDKYIDMYFVKEDYLICREKYQHIRAFVKIYSGFIDLSRVSDKDAKYKIILWNRNT